MDSPADTYDDPERQFQNAADESPVTNEPPEPSRLRSLGDGTTYAADDTSSEPLADADPGHDRKSRIVDLSERYTIEAELGAGGMGRVFKAFDEELQRPVAIKRVLEQHKGQAHVFQRFLKEARAIARVNHPSILQIYDYGRDADGPFLILEFADGGSLDAHLATCNDGRMELAPAVDIVCRVCDALTFAHERDIIHRDIKPANILLTSTGQPKLADFGLAKLETIDQTKTKAAAGLGTLWYMAPEQHRDAASVDACSDLWSLAATLYRLVTGRSPRVIRLEQVPKAIRAVLDRALEESPADRYPSVEEFRNALREATGAANEPTASLSPPPSTALLSPGQCRDCGQVNDMDRTCCMGCGAPMKEPCLVCDSVVGSWELFCGLCGANRLREVEKLGAKLRETRDDIDKLHRELQYEAALKLAGELAAIEHPRFRADREWASDQIVVLEQELDDRRNARDEALQQAQQRCQAGKFTQAIAILENIPVSVRDERVSDYLSKCQGWNAEFANLRAASAGIETPQMSVNSYGMKLIRIPAGEFLMGSPNDESGRCRDEQQHAVQISRSFFMGTHQVTQGQWQSVMQTQPWEGQENVDEGANIAASYISWDDAVEFCRCLSDLDGRSYRLPTEAEWEYACRAGTTTRYNFGDDDAQLADDAWYNANANDANNGHARKVGLQRPNAWGVYDMHGNVWEWCADRYGKDYYANTPQVDPQGPSSGSSRVLRGGAWHDSPEYCRSAYRNWSSPSARFSNFGFRVVCESE